MSGKGYIPVSVILANLRAVDLKVENLSDVRTKAKRTALALHYNEDQTREVILAADKALQKRLSGSTGTGQTPSGGQNTAKVTVTGNVVVISGTTTTQDLLVAGSLSAQNVDVIGSLRVNGNTVTAGGGAAPSSGANTSYYAVVGQLAAYEGNNSVAGPYGPQPLTSGSLQASAGSASMSDFQSTPKGDAWICPATGVYSFTGRLSLHPSLNLFDGKMIYYLGLHDSSYQTGWTPALYYQGDPDMYGQNSLSCFGAIMSQSPLATVTGIRKVTAGDPVYWVMEDFSSFITGTNGMQGSNNTGVMVQSGCAQNGLVIQQLA
jgi:hypothetical protein